MKQIMIMSQCFRCSMLLIRINILSLFILTISHAIIESNALHHSTQSMWQTSRMSAFNNYNSSSRSKSSSNNNNMILSHSNNKNNNKNNNNNDRFSRIREILYNTPNWHPNETQRWHKINMISNLFKHRVKRKTIPTSTKFTQSSVEIPSPDNIYDRINRSTNFLDFSQNFHIREILTAVQLNMLLKQRSIHNISDILAINLSHNVIKQIDASIFKSLAHVRRLDLSYNHIEWFNISVDGNQIEWLSISSNQLHTFDGKNLANLKYLDLSCNNIEHSTHIQLSELSELEYINLSGNRLSRFQHHVFEKLIKLKVISLSHNRFKSINNEMFQYVVDIEALDLSYNQIELVGNASFSHLPKLQYLDLSHNFIDAASLNVFLGIPNLIKLSIAFNTLLSDMLQGFMSSWSLKHLDMGGTGLCEIPNALTQSVRTLNLSNNEFAEIRCGDLDSYPLLQSLDISSSHILDVEDDALGRLDMLTSLHLNNNNIKRVPSSLPLNLVRLFLQNNQIAEIQSSTFTHLVNLEVVNLSGNQLTYLPSLPLPQLMVLDLRMSGLRRLSQSIIKISPKLRIIYLDGNPIKCNELLGIAEWATPCRTDDFIEFDSLDTDKTILNNDSSDMWSFCKCNACQLIQPPINLTALHCTSKNASNIKRQMNVGQTIDIGTNIESSHLNGTWLRTNSKSINKSNSIDMVNGVHAYQRPLYNQTIMVYQQLKRLNNSNLHDNPASRAIKINEMNRIVQIEPTNKATVPKTIAQNEPVSPTQSHNIVTNGIQNANRNISDDKSSLVAPISIRNMTMNAQSNTMDKMDKMVEFSTTSSYVTTNTHKTINFTESNIESITNIENKNITTQIQMPMKTETFNTNKMEFHENEYKIPSSIMNSQMNQNIDKHHEANEMSSILSKKLENLISTESSTSHTTILPIAADNTNSVRMNISQPPKDDDDHKKNKPKVNWNINKVISTANDNLQQNRNLVISTFHANDDNALDSVHINEINKNQLANRNQLNKNHILNTTDAREKSGKVTTQQQMCLLMKNCTPKETENFDKGLNQRIINSNTFTEIGMIINVENENSHEMNTVNRNSNDLVRKNIVGAESVRISNPASELWNVNKESAHIDSTKMSTIPSILSDQRRNINTNTNTNTMININNTLVERKSSSIEIETDNANVTDNDSKRTKLTTTIQQIKNTVKLTTETISKKENPLIGHVSQNVSIIDNEHQFERHININQSMHEQITLGSDNKHTQFQSANAHVQQYTQDRYDNRNSSSSSSTTTTTTTNNNSHDNNDGHNSSDVSDNSAIYGVSEQWNDKRVTSGHSGLFFVIGIGIGVFVSLNLVHLYRCKKRYNHQCNGKLTERNRQAQNLLVGMQMEMLNSLHYTDTPIDLW